MINENDALLQDTKLQNGKFVIKKTLGQGGFGITYLCDHLLMGLVVVKELFLYQACRRETAQFQVKPLISAEEFALYKDRFLDEAKTLVKLKQIDGIVHVFDFFEENNTVYFAMEYIAAESLLDLITEYRRLQDKMPEYLAIEIIEKVSISLQKVHELGILHRDIKPHNILVGDKWKPYLIDFGIARSFQEGKTAYHTTMATPGYSAPEQMTEEGKKSASMDIYALGATLYFCLTQKHPQTLAEMAVNGYISPKQLNPAISDKTNAAIVKAMELKSENRFQNIAEWLAALGIERKEKQEEPRPNQANQPDKTLFIPIEKQPITEIIAPKPVSQAPKIPKNSLLKVALLISVIGAIGAIFIFSLSIFEKKSPKPAASYETKKEAYTRLPNNPLTMEWAEDANSKGLLPDWQELMFTPYENSFACKVTGYLKLDKIEVSKLAIQMAFFDENETLAHTENYEPIPQGDEITYRSGDLIPIHLLVYEEKAATKAWKKVKMKVAFIEKNKAAGNSSKTKILPVKWLNAPNENYELTIKSRFDNFSEGFNKKESYHKFEYEVSNMGNYSFNQLKLALYYYGKKGNLLDKCERYAFTDSDPKLNAGQTRIFYSTCGFDAPLSAFEYFEVVVLEYK